MKRFAILSAIALAGAAPTMPVTARDAPVVAAAAGFAVGPPSNAPHSGIMRFPGGCIAEIHLPITL